MKLSSHAPNFTTVSLLQQPTSLYVKKRQKNPSGKTSKQLQPSVISLNPVKIKKPLLYCSALLQYSNGSTGKHGDGSLAFIQTDTGETVGRFFASAVNLIRSTSGFFKTNLGTEDII